jgi:hypothetical protein
MRKRKKSRVFPTSRTAQKPVTKPRRYSKIVAVVKYLKYNFLPSFERESRVRLGSFPWRIGETSRIILSDCDSRLSSLQARAKLT